MESADAADNDGRFDEQTFSRNFDSAQLVSIVIVVGGARPVTRMNRVSSLLGMLNRVSQQHPPRFHRARSEPPEILNFCGVELKQNSIFGTTKHTETFILP